MIFKAPLGNMAPMSPVWIHPSSSIVSFVLSSYLKYPEKLLGPLKQISPLELGSSVEK